MSNQPTSNVPGMRSWGELAESITKTANRNKAAAKQASATVPSVPEKDPNEKGKAPLPIDPQATNKVEKLPPQSTNADVTPATTLTPDKKVDGEEKVAFGKRLAATVANLKALKKSATAAEITPTLPTDKANDNKNTTATAPATEHGPNKGAGGDPATKAAEKGDMPMTADPTAEKPPTPPKDSKGAIPESAKNTDDGKTKEKEKMASDINFASAAELDPSFAMKIASVILSTEEGRKFAQGELEKAAGAAQAADIIKAASFMESRALELLEAEESGRLAAQAAWDAASPEEKAHIEKVAAVHTTALAQFEHDFEKLAYDQGASDAAGMQDAGMMGGAGGAPGGGGMPPGMDGGAGGMDGGAGGGADGGQVSDEEILQVLQQMVQSGEVQPQQAQEILQALMGGGQGGGDQGGMPPGGGMGDPGGDPDGGGMPGGDGSGGPPGKAAKDSKPKKEKAGDDGGSKEASVNTVESIIKEASAAADAAVEELLTASTKK